MRLCSLIIVALLLHLYASDVDGTSSNENSDTEPVTNLSEKKESSQAIAKKKYKQRKALESELVKACAIKTSVEVSNSW